jgi:hypothetical protein
MRRLFALPVLLLALLAVATPAHAQKRGDRSLITRFDLDEAGTSIVTAMDAVQRLRPNWLRPPLGRTSSAEMLDPDRRSSNATEPIVYVDERRQPNLDVLRELQASKIKEMKYLDQNRGVQMLGPGHEAGAILVSTFLTR